MANRVRIALFLLYSLALAQSSTAPTSNTATESIEAKITSPPTLITQRQASGEDPDFSSCLSASSFLSVCNSLTPGFTTLSTQFVLQAPCLCYNQTSWNPDLYDGWVNGCFSYVKTADPTDYSQITAENPGQLRTDPCRIAGDVFSEYSYTPSGFGATSAPLPTTSSTTTTTAVPTTSFFSGSNNGAGLVQPATLLVYGSLASFLALLL